MATIINKIEVAELAELKRLGQDGETSDDTVINYYKTNKQIGFVNNVGDAIASNTTVTLWYYRTPVTDGSEDISESVVPIVDQRWDDCLVFLACYYMTGKMEWFSQYQAELARMRTLQASQIDRAATIQNTGEYD